MQDVKPVDISRIKKE